MFGTILITFAITALSMTVLFQRYAYQERRRENSRLVRENENLERQIADRKAREINRKEREAYNQGLYDGRETDALYRKMLSKYTAGERATVMMDGIPNSREEY